MAPSIHGSPSAPPRAALLLPLAHLVHFAEEWFCGFSAWTLQALGNEISPERLLPINAFGFLMFLTGTVAAFLNPRLAWITVSFAALFGLNGLVHAAFTLSMRVYSPGTVTGLVVFIPLSIVVLRGSAARLPRGVFIGSVVFGILLHGLVTYLALL